MTPQTPLDRAFLAMEAAAEDQTARLQFFDRLAEAELFLMLEGEAEGDTVEPALFEVEGGRFVLAFDTEERLAGFAGRVVPYAALSGRALAAMLENQSVGVALNPDVAPSAALLPPEVMAWLAETLADGPDEAEAKIRELKAPHGLPEALLAALDQKLPSMAGMARCGYLVAATFDTGAQGHLLGFTGAIPGAEAALARAVQEALVFSGLEAGALDVTFLRDSDPLAAQMARVGLRFDLPSLPEPELAEPKAPGSDPEKPPILR